MARGLHCVSDIRLARAQARTKDLVARLTASPYINVNFAYRIRMVLTSVRAILSKRVMVLALVLVEAAAADVDVDAVVDVGARQSELRSTRPFVQEGRELPLRVRPRNLAEIIGSLIKMSASLLGRPRISRSWSLLLCRSPFAIKLLQRMITSRRHGSREDGHRDMAGKMLL